MPFKFNEPDLPEIPEQQSQSSVIDPTPQSIDQKYQDYLKNYDLTEADSEAKEIKAKADLDRLRKLKSEGEKYGMFMKGAGQIAEAFARGAGGKGMYTNDYGSELGKMYDTDIANKADDYKLAQQDRADKLKKLSGMYDVGRARDKDVTDLQNTRLSQTKAKQDITAKDLDNVYESQMNDPVSDVSKIYRSIALEKAKKMGIKDLSPIENATAKQLEKLKLLTEKENNELKDRYQQAVISDASGRPIYGTFDKVTGKYQSGDQVKGFAPQIRTDKRTDEMVAIQPALMGSKKPEALTGPQQVDVSNPQAQEAIAKGEKPVVDLDRGKLNNAQAKRVDDARKDLLKDVDDDRTAAQAAVNTQAILSAGKGELNGDIVRLVQNQLARSSGEKGAMTENDVAPFGGRGAVLDRLKRLVSISSTGKLPESDRKFLSDIASIMQRRANERIEDRTRFFRDNMLNDLQTSNEFKDVNINPKSVDNMLGIGNLGASNTKVATPTENMVKVQAPDGRIKLIPKNQLENAIKAGGKQVQ